MLPLTTILATLPPQPPLNTQKSSFLPEGLYPYWSLCVGWLLTILVSAQMALLTRCPYHSPSHHCFNSFIIFITICSFLVLRTLAHNQWGRAPPVGMVISSCTAPGGSFLPLRSLLHSGQPQPHTLPAQNSSYPASRSAQ